MRALKYSGEEWLGDIPENLGKDQNLVWNTVRGMKSK